MACQIRKDWSRHIQSWWQIVVWLLCFEIGHGIKFWLMHVVVAVILSCNGTVDNYMTCALSCFGVCVRARADCRKDGLEEGSGFIFCWLLAFRFVRHDINQDYSERTYVNVDIEFTLRRCCIPSLLNICCADYALHTYLHRWKIYFQYIDICTLRLYIVRSQTEPHDARETNAYAARLG